MDNALEIRIECDEDGCVSNLDTPLISWRSSDRQFTIELSAMPDFRWPSFMRHTRETRYVYDGGRLRAGTTYYVRVRSGLGPWSVTSFCTAG